MKAIVVYEPGNSWQLKLTDVPVPALKPGWSLVKVKAFGINRSEIFTRQGLSPSVVFPRILGIECTGIIVESNVYPRGLRIVSIMGEMGRAFDGSYAEYVLLPDEQIYPIDSDMPWVAFAAVPETYYTAYGAYLNLKIDVTDSILVRAAASGVGVAFAKLLKGRYPNIRLVGSTRHLTKQAQLLSVGYDAVAEERQGILQSDEQFTKIVELIGPATIHDSLCHLQEEGILCSCGQLGGKWYLENFDPIMELQKNVYLTTFYSGNVNQKKIQDLFNFIEQHHISVKPDKVFSLLQICQAHDYLEAADGFGKVVITTDV